MAIIRQSEDLFRCLKPRLSISDWFIQIREASRFSMRLDSLPSNLRGLNTSHPIYNAAMESFYGRYKTSSVRGHVFVGEEQARANAFEYIEVFYNRFRKHASLGYQSPAAFEANILPPMGGNSSSSLTACQENN